jgi:hypothetical protein
MRRRLPEFNMVRAGFPEWLALLKFIDMDVSLHGPRVVLPHTFSEEVALQKLAKYIRDTGTLPETISFDNYGPNDQKDFQFRIMPPHGEHGA